MSNINTSDNIQSFKKALPAVLFVASIFFLNFLSRVVLAPLMPVIEADLGFSHSGAGQLFLALAVGNAFGLLLSGFLSRAVYHRRTVGWSAILVGVSALCAPLAQSFTGLLCAMLAIGLAVGLYLPSGVATVTSLVESKNWGKTMAVHELAPSLAYVVAPLLAEGVLLYADWRMALTLLGILQLCLGIWFLKAGRGGDFPGVVPGPENVMLIVKRPVFWMLVLFFCIAVGSSIGMYSMIPLFLVSDHGYTREGANQLLAASRVAACAGPFLAGWITDRWGARPAILLYIVTNGASLLMIGFASGSLLAGLVLLQPVFSVLIMAPGFTVLALSFPPQLRSVTIALMGPINAMVGVGLVPTFLGYLGDAGHFDIGFIVMGIILLFSMIFLPFFPRGNASQQN